MRGFQSHPHHIGIADTFKCVICAALCQLDQMGGQITVNFRRVHEIGHAETLPPWLFVIIQINADNLAGANHPQTLNDIQANAAKTKDDGPAACLDLGCVNHRANPCGHAAANIADRFKRRAFVDFRQGNFRHNRMIGKG